MTILMAKTVCAPKQMKMKTEVKNANLGRASLVHLHTLIFKGGQKARLIMTCHKR